MAGSTRQSLEVKKWSRARRAQFALQQAFEKIEWEEKVLLPEIEALLSGKVRLEIEAGSKEAAQSIIRVVVAEELTDEAGSELSA